LAIAQRSGDACLMGPRRLPGGAEQGSALVGQIQGPCPPIDGLHAPLEQFANSLGYSVTIEALNGPEGVCSHREQTIAVEESLERNGQVAAMLHELAHALVRVDHREGDPKLTYAAEELVVESVAYSVAAVAGIDTSANSVPYLTAWSENTPIGTIHAHAELIDRLARRLEAVIADDSHAVHEEAITAA